MDGCESGAEQLCVRWLRSLPWKLNVRWPAEETGVVVYVELDRPGLVPCPPDRGFYVDGAATDEVIVERLEHLEPGPELATLLMEIEIRGELSLPTRAAVVIGWHRLGAWVAAREAGATWAAVEQAGPGSMLARSVAREIACATGVSSGRVGRTADLGLGMATHTTLGHAMGAGAMDRDKAEAILRYTDHLDREQATPVIDQAVQGAGLLTLGQVRSRTRALAGWSDPAQAADRHERAMSRRDVWVETAGDAMSYVHAFIDAPSAERILTTLNALALDVADGPDRSTGAFRGDAQSQELSVASPPEPPSVLPPAQLSPRVFAEVSGEASAGTQAQLSPRVFAEVSGEASAGTQAQASPRVFAEASGGASSGASGEASAGAQALGSSRVFAEVSGEASREASAGAQAQGSSRVFAEVSGEASREASAGAQAQASPQASVSRSVSGAPLPDSRTLGNVRADVLADLFGPSGPFANARSISGSRPRLMVHITAAALLGLARTPGELVGYGPIPASLARAVAQDATWQAMFTDPGSGRLVDIGARHLPPGLASEPAATLTGPGSGSGQSAGAPTEPNTEPSFEVSGAAPHVALALTDPQTAQSPRAPELTRGEGAPAPTARQPVNCESVESPQDSGAVNCEPAGLSQVSPMAQPSRPAEVSPPGRGLPPEQPPPTHPAAPVSPEAPTCPTCRRPIVGSVDSIDNPPFPVPPDLWPAETMFSNSYTPSGRLQELLAIRQPACVFPGCRAPAWRSDIDHHNPYTAGQPAQTQTTAANLGPACRADHQLKTHAGWTATRDSATGVVTITTAMGRVYRQLPPTPCTPPWSYPTH